MISDDSDEILEGAAARSAEEVFSATLPRARGLAGKRRGDFVGAVAAQPGWAFDKCSLDSRQLLASLGDQLCPGEHASLWLVGMVAMHWLLASVSQTHSLEKQLLLCQRKRPYRGRPFARGTSRG